VRGLTGGTPGTGCGRRHPLTRSNTQTRRKRIRPFSARKQGRHTLTWSSAYTAFASALDGDGPTPENAAPRPGNAFGDRRLSVKFMTLLSSEAKFDNCWLLSFLTQVGTESSEKCPFLLTHSHHLGTGFSVFLALTRRLLMQLGTIDPAMGRGSVPKSREECQNRRDTCGNGSEVSRRFRRPLLAGRDDRGMSWWRRGRPHGRRQCVL